MTRCVDCGRPFVVDFARQRRCWPCWHADRDYARGYAAGYAAASEAGTSLDVGLIRDLIQLTHPDRHPPERVALATRTTARLLVLLDRERIAA